MSILKTILVSALFFMFVNTQCLISQDDADIESYELTKKAEKYMDKERYDEALKLLKEAVKLYPDNIVAHYRMAVVYYEKKNYQKTIDILEPLTKHRDRADLVFKTLGKAYDKLGNKEKALETYNKGLDEYPYSGPLYAELGEVEAAAGNTDKALQQYEFGIKFDPNYSSNYYHASKILLGAGSVWGLIYGEIFLNLGSDTTKWNEISRLLFNTYKNRYNGTESTPAIEIDIQRDTAAGSFEYVYNSADPTLADLSSGDELSLRKLNEMRQAFIETWYNKNYSFKFPSEFFDFLKRSLDDGFLEMYNYLIYSEGSIAEFNKYRDMVEKKGKKFNKWYNENYFKFNNKKSVYRGMYNK